jgi:WD40 repeat protein
MEWSIAGGEHWHRYGWDALALSADAKTMAATSAGAIQFWDAGARPGRAGLRIPEDDREQRNWSALAFSRDGTLLAAGAPDRPVRLIDMTGKIPMQKRALKIKGTPGVMAFTPEGDWLAVSEGGDLKSPGFVHVFHVEIGKEVWSFMRPKAWVHSLTFSPDGRELAISWYDGLVTVLEIASRRPRAEFQPGRGSPYAIAYAPNSKRLATAGRNGHVAVWEWGEQRWSTQLPGAVHAIAWSPDGRHLTTGNANGTIFVLRVP